MTTNYKITNILETICLESCPCQDYVVVEKLVNNQQFTERMNTNVVLEMIENNNPVIGLSDEAKLIVKSAVHNKVVRRFGFKPDTKNRWTRA